MRGFRWFSRAPINPEEQRDRELVTASGSVHQSEPLLITTSTEKIELKKKLTSRCYKCKKFMGSDDGFQIFMSDNWRLHIPCFSKLVDKALKNNPNEQDVLSLIVRPTSEESS